MERVVKVMNSTLFKRSFKSNRILILIISAVLLMYTAIMVAMFDPENVEAIAEMMSMFPEGFGAAFGFNEIATNLTSHIGLYLYGFIYIVFPLIFIIIVTNGAIAKHVDNGSMAYLLATPNTRKKIATTQAVFVITSITLIFIFQVIMGIVICESMFSGLLEIDNYILLNVVTLLVSLVIAGIGFVSSCYFSETRYSLAFGAGIPIGFVLLNMLSGANEKLEGLRYFTVYSLIDITKIFNDSSFVLMTSVSLLVATVVLFGIGIYIFDKKSLNI